MAATPSEVARRWFEEVWNQQRADTIDELLAVNAVGHLATGDVKGPSEFRKFHAAFLAAVPDESVHVDKVMADANDAVVHWRIQGTHQGEILGLKPTGRKVTIDGMTRFVVKDGQIVEGWDCWDLGGLKEKLSVAAEV